MPFRIDGVFLPQPNTLDYPIYFAEVQFQTDLNFYSRFLTEIFLYLNKTDLTNDWRGVVLFPTQRLDPGIPIRYQEFFDSNRIRRIYLNELPDTDRNVQRGLPPQQTALQ